MALGLATLTLLASLFLVAQGFLGAPEALASCREETGCGDVFYEPTSICCCYNHTWMAYGYRWCWWREVDCTVNWDKILVDQSCYHGTYCDCIYPPN